MKVIVIGGTGLIGTKVVARLRADGHEVVPASPSTGVDILTGAGLTQTIAGADVVIDVSNAPSFEDAAAMAFFTTAGRTIAAAEAAAGVRHHVALSVVGTDRLQASGYFRAKQAQEHLIEASGIPFTILRATQFFEFLPAIAGAATIGNEVRLPSAAIQPILADDVAAELARVATAAPANARVDLAGPDRAPIDAVVRRYLAAIGDPRRVTTDASAGYFGLAIDDRSLVPLGTARIAPTHVETWLAAAGR